MTKLKNIQEAIKLLNMDDYSPNVLKDILFNLFTFNTQFQGFTANEIIIVAKHEEYEKPDLIAEFDVQIDNYHKTLYILSNSGEWRKRNVWKFNASCKKLR